MRKLVVRSRDGPARRVHRRHVGAYSRVQPVSPARSAWSSSGGESHPSALPEPDVKLSLHPAPTLQPLISSGGVASGTGSSHFWLTSTLGQRAGPLRSTRVTRLPRYCEPVRPFASHRYSAPHGSTTWRSPFTSRRQVPTFRTRACAGLTPSPCRSPLGQSTGIPRASSRAKRTSSVSMTSLLFRHVVNGSLAFVFPALT